MVRWRMMAAGAARLDDCEPLLSLNQTPQTNSI